MKTFHPPVLILAALFVTFSAALLRAEDWTTTDGKVYQKVKVIRTEADAVTITYVYGGALIPLEKLPTDLQKRFDYDPDKAQAAADARAKSDAENAKALEAEAKLAAKLKADRLAKEDANHRAAARQLASTKNLSLPPLLNLAHPTAATDQDVINAAHHGNLDPFDRSKYANGDLLGKPVGN